MRRLAGTIVAVALTACPAAPAEGVTFQPCERGSEVECAQLPVPLDRAAWCPDR